MRLLRLFAVSILLPLALFSVPASASTLDSAEVELKKFAFVSLDVDLSVLSKGDRQVVPLLIEAAEAMEGVFRQQSLADILSPMDLTPAEQKLLAVHYGPWDRYAGFKPLFPQLMDLPRPPGAGFYPPDMDRATFSAAAEKNSALKSAYSMVRRSQEGKLQAVPYRQAYQAAHQLAAEKLRQAAAVTDSQDFARYLNLRAEALLSDDYRPSDMAWMSMRGNALDLIIGPIEFYEDQLFGHKAAHEAFLLLKDQSWSARLNKLSGALPGYQKLLPVPAAYRAEIPGDASDLGAYDLIWVAGDAAVTRPIAVNLPNDPVVQQAKGSRRLQFKNAMAAKFNTIMQPMAGLLLDITQRKDVTFDGMFTNTMLHEVGHGLGIRQTLNGKGSVDDALGSDAWMVEEAKADLLSLFITDQLFKQGEISAEIRRQRYVTFFLSTFRAIRFGPSNSHARENLIRFNIMKEQGVFKRNADGRYLMDLEKFSRVNQQILTQVLTLQGDGDHEGVKAWEKRYGVMDAELKADLARVEAAGVPKDVVFYNRSPMYRTKHLPPPCNRWNLMCD
uniref:Zn-dependent hydrolase n=1 Tax=Magnetococcus massalia (strain MO-1) TaxID=451514 RepID=A0A1S7LGD4_MAGMO|nr:Conserved exported protein of unknown function [Candidatus Magnetococcus massalia]